MTDPTQSGAPPWMQSGWLNAASVWISQRLEERRILITGEIDQFHVRPWSTVLRIATSEGELYFKAVSSAFAHEPRLTQLLGQLRPDIMPELLVIDPEQGWLLMRSSGVMLRTLIEAPEDSERHWTNVLPLYAELQIEMSERRAELLATGALDYRLEQMPAKFEDLLADNDMLRIGQPDGLNLAEHQRLVALTPWLAERCEQLLAAPIPETLHHDDFHDGNVFYLDGRYILADWAESGIAHPFCTLVVALRSIAYRAGVEPDDPLILRLRDSYLEPWQRYATQPELLEIARLAQPLGALARSLTWRRAVADLTGPNLDEYGEAVPGWLQEFLAMLN